MDAAIAEIYLDDPAFARYADAATHMTVSPNKMVGGTKINVIADHARTEIDIRALPDMDRTVIDQHLRKAMGTAGDQLEIEPILDSPSTTSSRDNILWQAILGALEHHTGSRAALPMLMTGFIDARFWRERGGVAYGVGLFDSTIEFGEFLGLFHGNDERVSVASLMRTTALLGTILEQFGALSARSETSS